MFNRSIRHSSLSEVEGMGADIDFEHAKNQS